MLPHGKVKAINIIPNEPVNTVSVSATVICEDEKGVRFTTSFASFLGDLKPYSPTQPLDYNSWCNAVKSLDRWHRLGTIKGDFYEAHYRKGSTPKVVFDEASRL